MWLAFLTWVGADVTIRPVHVNTHFENVFMWCLCFLVALLLISSPSLAQTERASLPDPVKFVNKFDIVWNVARAVLNDMGYGVELEDKAGGRISTKPYVFVTGSLTPSEIDKVAIKSNTATGSWVRARYSVETILEIVNPRETLVTVRTKMEGLNRDLDGTEKWLPLESLGLFEKRILGKLSLKLMGNELDFENKKGFWDKSPQPVDSRRPKPYPTRPPL